MNEITNSEATAPHPTADSLWEHSQRLREQMNAGAHLVVYLVQGEQLEAADREVATYFDKLELWTELVQQRRDIVKMLGCE